MLCPNTNEEASSSESNIRTLHLPTTQSTEPSSECIVTLSRRKQRFEPTQRIRLRNDLLLLVGYLELFNALDFPANIWNSTPIPPFVVALMAIGGSIAIIASTFAFVDLKRSWHNVCALRAERRFLHNACSAGLPLTVHQQHIQAWLSLNFREYGWELIDRLLMDALVGFAAILVGTGTLMAIGGSDPNVDIASNLLSGYVGNSFVALYSVVNAGWSGYLYVRARRHKRVVKNFIREPTMRRRAVQNFRNHQLYAVLNGITLLVSGAGSLITSSFWWGYVILIPCIPCSVLCNILWRKRIGYDRILKQFQSSDALELNIYFTIEDSIKSQDIEQDARFSHEKLKSLSTHDLLAYLDANEMLEDLCVHVANDPITRKAFGIRHESSEIVINRQMLEAMDSHTLLRAAQSVVDVLGVSRAQDRERTLYELLGAYLHIKEEQEKMNSQSRESLPTNQIKKDMEQETEKSEV